MPIQALPISLPPADLSATDLLLGAALQQAGLHHLVTVVTHTAPHDYDAEFRQAIDAMLEGHEALLHRSR